MRILKSDINIYYMLTITLVIPILIGLYLQNFSNSIFISIPLHSVIESLGAAIAFILSVMIFLIYKKSDNLNYHHRASFAFITMGVFDIFHASVYPGEIFVWLHSLAIFFGGVLFSTVWLFDIKINRRSYYLIPASIFLISFLISIYSILYPESIPSMLNDKKEFTHLANLLNIIGGFMYVLASFYFIKKYIDNEKFIDLVLAGQSMLFGSAGLLFFFSSLWDISWWFWHSLRLVAYFISLFFIFKIFAKNLEISDFRLG